MSGQPGEPQPAGEAQPYGEVFERGYRHYEGRREGRERAVNALAIYSVKRGLGIKKGWTSKIAPFGLYALAFVPVIVFVGVRGLLGPLADQINFTYFDLFQSISMILLLFAAAVAPEMLCDDRREHVLQLYFSRAITRGDYLLAKVGALGFMVGSIAFLPALLLFLGNTFQAPSPGEYLAAHAADIGRIVGAGGLNSVYYTAIALAVAAFVDRKGIASASIVGGMLVISGIGAALFEAISADWHRYIVLIIPVQVTEGINRSIFDVPATGNMTAAQANLSGGWYLASILVVTAMCGVVMYRRYLMED